MPDDLSSLSLKSMELPSKTMAKLKALGLRTIKDLYAVPLSRLIEVGLSLREAEELAAAAPDFGVSWKTVAEVRAAFVTPAGPPSTAQSKPATHIQPLRGELLDDARLRALHTVPAFRALFRGYPAYEARLQGTS